MADTYERDHEEFCRTLRGLRKRAGLTGDELAERAGMSQSKISKIETGRTLPSVADVETLVQVLAVPDDVRAELVGTADTLNTRVENHRLVYHRGLATKQREIGVDEAATTTHRAFDDTIVSGLLQTPDYARVIFTGPRAVPAEMPQAVAARLDRQTVLYEPDKHFHFLLTENVLRRRLGTGRMMAAQLDRIAQVSTLDNVRLGVIPWIALLPEGPENSFSIDDERLVAVGTFTRSLTLTDPADVEAYLAVFARFERCAVYDDEARALLAQISREFLELD